MPDEYDDLKRALTPEETRTLKRVRPTLLYISDYLQNNSFTRTLAEAQEFECCVAQRDTTADAHNPAYGGTPPLALNIFWLAQWCRNNLRVEEPVPLLAELEAALAFMNVLPAATFQGVGESRLHRRVGWWRMSAETHQRIIMRNYRPSLKRMPGRPVTVTGPADPGRVARHLTKVSTPEFNTMVIDYLIGRKGPTPLLALARAENRPLAVRLSGRPSRIDPYSAYRTDQVMLHAAGMAAFSIEHAERRGLTPLSPAAMELAFRTAVAADPTRYSYLQTFRTMDSRNAMRAGKRWILVQVDKLPSNVALDMDDGRAEYDIYRDWLAERLRQDKSISQDDFVRAMADYHDSLTPRR